MIKYDDLEVTEEHYNDSVSGLNDNYSFFGLLRYSAQAHLKGENIIGVAYYKSDPFKNLRIYSHISFHKNLSDFFKTDKKEWSGIHHMLFKSVSSETEGKKIINDIKSKHKSLT